MLTEESGASDTYKNRVLEEVCDRTVLTNTFSGKQARGIENKFIHYMTTQSSNHILPYPLQNSLTSPIRKAAQQKQDADYLSLWCGTNGYLGKRQSVKSLFESLI